MRDGAVALELAGRACRETAREDSFRRQFRARRLSRRWTSFRTNDPDFRVDGPARLTGRGAAARARPASRPGILFARYYEKSKLSRHLDTGRIGLCGHAWSPGGVSRAVPSVAALCLLSGRCRDRGGSRRIWHSAGPLDDCSSSDHQSHEEWQAHPGRGFCAGRPGGTWHFRHCCAPSDAGGPHAQACHHDSWRRSRGVVFLYLRGPSCHFESRGTFKVTARIPHLFGGRIPCTRAKAARRPDWPLIFSLDLRACGSGDADLQLWLSRVCADA